jgi:hypothetical protein
MTIKELKNFIEMVITCGVREDAEVYVKGADSTSHYELEEEDLWFSLTGD